MMSQLLANTLPSWTSARRVGLPSSLASLSEVPAASAYSPTLHGSHWQRFINAFALELEVIQQSVDDASKSIYLEYPAYSHQELDVVYEYSMPGLSTVVLSASANDQAISIGTNPNGSLILDPLRSAGIQLIQATRLFDFYYGVSALESFASGSTVYAVKSRVAKDSQGIDLIQYVTVADQPVSYTLSNDRKTITLTSTAADTVKIHYVTYDIFYQLADNSKIYVRMPFYELFLNVSGPVPITVNPLSVMPSGLAIVNPQIFMVWNELDEIGLLMSLPRHTGETNALYARRLVDSTLYRPDSTLPGLRNALAVELGLVHHLLWGTQSTDLLNTPVLTASSIALGSGSVYPDSILVDRLPLEYYSVVNANGNGGNLTTAIPSLAAGESFTINTVLMATGGNVVPSLVPLRISHTVPYAEQAIYDQIVVDHAGSVFSAPNVPWFAGSLQVWKNGTPLVRGTDFTELSTTSFSLTVPAQENDRLQLGYVLPDISPIPSLEAQADIETDLSATIQFVAQYLPSTSTLSTATPGIWQNLPPGTDVDAQETGATWTLSITATNIGLVPFASGSNFTVSLPGQVKWDGNYLSISDNRTWKHSVSYIDGSELWVNNLTDASIHHMLYTASGLATPMLKQLADEITDISPLEWGSINWDRGIWRSINQRYSQFGFIPKALDPQYDQYLSAQQMMFTGSLAGTQSFTGLSAISGTAIAGQNLSGHIPTGDYSVALSPGIALGASQTLRYPDFRSGIGSDDDLLLSYANEAEVELANESILGPVQRSLLLADIGSVLPASASAAWPAAINPGVYYLNQEQHYLFSRPVYAETTTQQVFLEGCDPKQPIKAYLYDATTGLKELRRVYFTDGDGNLTLVCRETVSQEQSGYVLLSYSDVGNLTAIDSLTHSALVPSASGANQVVFPLGHSSIDVSYTLNGSYIVVEGDNGSTFLMDKAQSSGVLIVYEGGEGPQITNMPLHPYYNPRTQGFVYLSSDYYLPTKLEVWADPTCVPAASGMSYNVKAKVTDSYGSGVAGLPVTILVNYTEGTLTASGLITDTFGYVNVNIGASQYAQTAQVTATMQMVDQSGLPLSALIGSTFIEVYATYR